VGGREGGEEAATWVAGNQGEGKEQVAAVAPDKALPMVSSKTGL